MGRQLYLLCLPCMPAVHIVGIDSHSAWCEMNAGAEGEKR